MTGVQTCALPISHELEEKKKLLIEDWEKKFGKGKKSIDIVLNKYI